MTYSARKRGGKIEIDLRKLEEVRKKVEKVLSGGGSINNIHGELQIENSLFEDKVSFGVNFKESLILLFNAVSERSIRDVVNRIYQVWIGVNDDSKTTRGSIQTSLEGFLRISEPTGVSSELQ